MALKIVRLAGQISSDNPVRLPQLRTGSTLEYRVARNVQFELLNSQFSGPGRRDLCVL